ncbi:hypothetical protein NPX13_g2028 [Xylaria arbuscula]|uniref:CorA-like transporter domain-containing protein n=1 Tax=Xylaria arbuscula TaxID=114810 RepID=A0A9W8NLB4_9PEZI|nr:hypothetical protein NPX13_g2028 [Xylaria arbuscula]
MAYMMPVTSPTLLESLNERLKESSKQLFVKSENDVEIAWRDFGLESGVNLSKLNIHKVENLTEMIGCRINLSTRSISSYQQDPQCRFIYLFGITSLSALKITQEMFVQILTFHQVMPDYVDFVTAFGLQEKPQDLRFSSFKKQVSLAPSARMQKIAGLARSGQQYQLCYNLKHSTKNTEGGFSIRQAAIYHKFDAVTGKTLWLVTAGRRDLHERYKSLTGNGANPENKSFDSPVACFRSSLAAHSMFCAWAIENWRWHIKLFETNLEEAVCSQQQTSLKAALTVEKTGLTVIGPRGTGEYHQKYQPGDLQTLQRHEEEVYETLAALEANMRIFNSLHKFYSSLKRNKHFPLRQNVAEYLDLFINQVEDFMSDTEHLVQRAYTLLKTTDGRKQLVVQHFQSQSTENMEKMNSNMEKETVLVRIVTIVTLIYLPATFVSLTWMEKTFFSTDVIKYQNGQSDSGSFSYIAMVRWLQVALPLTTITLLLAWLWNLRAKQQLRYGEETRGWPLWFCWGRKPSSPLPLYSGKVASP